jgi:hypothetical protein
MRAERTNVVTPNGALEYIVDCTPEEKVKFQAIQGENYRERLGKPLYYTKFPQDKNKVVDVVFWTPENGEERLIISRPAITMTDAEIEALIDKRIADGKKQEKVATIEKSPF